MYINTYQTTEPHGVYNSDTVKLTWLDQFDLEAKKTLRYVFSRIQEKYLKVKRQ